MVTREELITKMPLNEFYVHPHEISQGDVDSLRSALEAADGEPAMQTYLEEQSFLLVQHLNGGHGRWVIPHKRLGAHFVPDFLIGDKDSMGFHWIAVELKSPTSPLFNAKGDPSKELTHAIRQIMDYRNWIGKNIDHATRSREELGLGLTDINDKLPGLIIMGRRAKLNSSTRDLRKRLGNEHKIEIHTYDWLVNTTQGWFEVLENKRR